MASVKCWDGGFEKAMRKFKKKVMNENILQEVRDRQYFMKPSEKRNRAKAAARQRWKKKQRESNPQQNQEY